MLRCSRSSLVALCGLIVPALCSAAAAAVTPPEVLQLKNLCLTTEIVADGQARATLVVSASGAQHPLATKIVTAVEAVTGVKLPIVSDTDAAAALPATKHLIALGNRSSNGLIEQLYQRYYTLLDRKYPGAGGHVVRTLHNPFGDQLNIVLVGGSDTVGTEAAVDVLIAKLREATAGDAIRLGRLAEIHLDPGIKLPDDIRKVETWEASAGYGSSGYFGWNSISKHMALYHMTGKERHAREVLRLAFPDDEAKRQITQIDGERIEDKDHPLSGPYHYNAHMMILFWDLIEESPVFSDAERLRVTRAFAKQVGHWERSLRLTKPLPHVGSRHGQWDAISLFCLARYFDSHYPDPFWAKAKQAGLLHFRSLHEHAWVSGENDNLFWYNTATAPILTYMMLSGDRVPLENGVLAHLLSAQEALISGRRPDRALNSAALGYLHKAAALTQDGRWLTYRQRTGVDTGIFRVGQSYWPDAKLKPTRPQNLVGRWNIDWLPASKWKRRHNGLPLDQSFNFGSYRSTTGGDGDFLLLDGFNGASRNPYHTFAILELRLRGCTLLKGYLNQVICRVDGLMEPEIAMNAALRHHQALGSTALSVGQVPNAPFANWQRTVVQRVGRYTLLIDALTFRTESPNAEVLFEWETELSGRQTNGAITFSTISDAGKRETKPGGFIVFSEPDAAISGGGRRWTHRWVGPVKKDETKLFFSVVGVQPGVKNPQASCLRGTHRNGQNVAITLPSFGDASDPEPVLLDVLPPTSSDAVPSVTVAERDHLFAQSLTEDDSLLWADRAVDVDWDFRSGRLYVEASQPTMLRLVVVSNATLRLDGKEVATQPVREPDGVTRESLQVAAGRHLIEGALPEPKMLKRRTDSLEKALATQSKLTRPAAESRQAAATPEVDVLVPLASLKFPAAVADLETIPTTDGLLLAVAEGTAVHLLSTDGNERFSCAADASVRLLRWWPEAELLLAGCADEKVLAFDLQGERRWEFVSEMDPAVFRAAKDYWFKTAPGHEGIHGLSTGSFLEGGTQAFVGSACTLEILDGDGKLLHRMPQFWGKVSHFRLVEGPNGSTNLLASRKYNGTNTVAIINSRSLNPTPRGFLSVPAGHTYVGGWSCMNRLHLFYEDVTGDDTREVISEINGTWNRVVVWTSQGKPLFAANFGPGPRIPVRTIRDLVVCDLQGDGKMAIMAATAYNMLVALDGQCRHLWSTRLPSPPNVLAAVRPQPGKPAALFVGCDDRQVRRLDAAGNLLAAGPVAGRPTQIETIDSIERLPLVVVGTDQGGLTLFEAKP